LRRQWTKIQEASEDITSWGISVSSPKTSLEEESNKKDKRKERSVVHPRCAAIRREGVKNHAEKTSFYTHLWGVHLREKRTFSVFDNGFKEKTQFYNPKPIGNQHINTTHLIHKFSFRTKLFKRKANTRSIKGEVSPRFMASVFA
jgi:hypothetical protein